MKILKLKIYKGKFKSWNQKPNCSGIVLIMNTANYEALFNHHVTWSKQWGNMCSNDLQVKKTGSERRELTRTGINSRSHTLYRPARTADFTPRCIWGSWTPAAAPGGSGRGFWASLTPPRTSERDRSGCTVAEAHVLQLRRGQQVRSKFIFYSQKVGRGF